MAVRARGAREVLERELRGRREWEEGGREGGRLRRERERERVKEIK